MTDMTEKLKNKIIISCQASVGEPIFDDDCLLSIVKSVISGGTSGLRLAGVKDIANTRKFSDIPIIGITKPDPLPADWKEIVYITSTFKDAKKISDVGADIIAIDGTLRKRPEETLEELIKKIHAELQKPVMADCSTLKEGLKCEEFGANIISTTLSGYTKETLTKNNGEPDFELLEALVKSVKCPVILEGRIWTTEHVKKAFDLGAYAVVIGSAVTRPQVITQRFVNAVKPLNQ